MSVHLTPEQQELADRIDANSDDDPIHPVLARNLYFNRDNQPITLGTWAALKNVAAADYGKPGRDYTVIARDEVAGYLVTTVWIGINTAFFGSPRIFETMVFDNSYGLVESWKWATEADAREGHVNVIDRYRAEEEGVSS